MKIYLLMVAAFFLFTSQEPMKLSGVYKLEYDSRYQLQSCTMTFNDSTYSKKLPDGLTSKGQIVYEKYKVTLKPIVKDDPIEIDARELANDTVKFTTKSKTDRSMTINRGTMIRIR